MSEENEWEEIDEDVVDFENIQSFIPLEEPVIKRGKEDEKIANFSSNVPKPAAFNINFRDLESVVSALTAIEMQLQNNIIELKKLDNIASRAKALTELDTQKITEQIEKLGFTQIARKITDSLKTELEAQKKEIYVSLAAAEAAAKDLSVKAENLRVVSDSFKNLDNMAQDLDEFVQKFKKMSTKSLYLGVIVATITGIFAGSILSYSLQLVGGGGDGARWLEFANLHNLQLERDQNGLDVLVMPKSQQIMGRNQENLTMWIFQPKELKK